jgi:hypothetical protein
MRGVGVATVQEHAVRAPALASAAAPAHLSPVVFFQLPPFGRNCGDV